MLIKSPAEIRRDTLRRLSTQIASCTLFCKGREAQLVTAEQMEKLKGIQARTDKFQAVLATLGYDKPILERKRVMAAYSADPSPENIAAVEKLDDKETARERMRQKMTPLKSGCMQTASEAMPIVKEIRDRAATLCDAEIERLFADGERIAATYGITHEPGPVLGALQNLADALRWPAGIPSTGPRTSLAGIVTI